jgi:hypothetical protein
LSDAGYTHDPEIAARFLDPLGAGTAFTAGFCAIVVAIAILRTRKANESAAMLAVAAAAVSALIAPPLRTVSADLYRGVSATGRKLLEMGGPSAGRWRAWADANRSLPLPDEEAGMNEDEQRLVGLRESLWPQLQAIDGIDGAAVYSSTVDPNYHAVLSNATDAARELLGIAFYVVPPGSETPPGTPRSESGFLVLERPRTERAFLVHQTRVAGDLDVAISQLRSMSIAREALVPAGGPLLTGPAVPASAHLHRPAPDRIDVSVDTPAAGLLVVSEHYDPGWSAKVDGSDAPVIPVDVIVLGVAVPPGHHSVRLRYVPVGFVPGLVCAALTTLALAVLALRQSPRPYSRIL